MFIRLFDARLSVVMLLPVKDIKNIKEYTAPTDRDAIEGARSVVMTAPIDASTNRTHDYFVSETIDEIEQLLVQACQNW